MAYSFMDLALEVLKGASGPLTYQEIWQVGQQAGLASKLRTAGRTPWNSLGAQLYVDVRDNASSRFIGRNTTRLCPTLRPMWRSSWTAVVPNSALNLTPSGPSLLPPG